MPSASVLRVLLRELTALRSCPRQTEPELVMEAPDQVESYARAGLEGGVMAPVYLFHCANICEVIRPGNRVLDLACGPANQLAMVARLNSDVAFVGVDLSDTMLERARALADQQGLKNIELQRADITDLSRFADASFDAVMSTMALHHLPDPSALIQTFSEAARLLRAGGGVYMADFGRLKTEESMYYFANQYKDKQPRLFTEDYLNSLRAAFTVSDFRRASSAFAGRAHLYTTFLSPFMVVLKSPPRRDRSAETIIKRLSELKNSLSEYHRIDFADLRTFFRFGGLKCEYI